MRAPNSQRSLGAPSSTLLVVSSSIVLTILLIVPSPASTRSVIASAHPDIVESGIVLEKLSFGARRASGASIGPGRNEHEFEDDEKWAAEVEADIRNRKNDIKDPIGVIGESPLPSGFASAKSVEESVKDDQGGIRRFDAEVANDGTLGKASTSKIDKAQNRSDASSEGGKIVIKGIIVRDDPIDAESINEALVSHGVVETSKVKQHRKRSLSDAEPVGAESPKEDSTKENLDASSGRVHESSHDARDEGTDDSVQSRRVPVLIPVGSSHAKPHHKLPKHVEEVSSKLDVVDVSPEHSEKIGPLVEESLNHAETKQGKSEICKVCKDGKVEQISKSIDAREESIEVLGVNDESGVVAPEGKIIIGSDGLGDVERISEENSEQVQNARKSLPIADENAEDDDSIGASIEDENADFAKNLKPLKNQDSLDYDSSSLNNIVKTNVSLEGLKLQAISIQKDIKNETLLKRLKDEAVQILPGIPKFNEHQLLEALKIITSDKKKGEENPEHSYLSKMDSSSLTQTQLKILRCTESLVVREQRQTFAENMFECFRGLSILNCMRIFVWPVIADNIPESLSQNLPTLPIEVNVMDWLPGNQRVEPKNTRSRSTTSPHQQRLVTPELVVSGILKEALSANPSSDETPTTFIDPHNETLSKLLTPGQLEILKMAEKFLPESARQEYSNRMYSCVRRFEYFSCIKYFAWPMVKQHFKALPDFPDYQSWYPSATLYPGYPVLPFPNSEGIGELPEVVEADATRTRRPRPEAVIVNILENTLKQTANLPFTYQARRPESNVVPVTADQMAIFYLAEQLIPIPMRAEFMTKTMNCIRDYDYLTCTKYVTWPTVRQSVPSLPSFPDFSGWIPTFAVPDFSQYIPDFGSWIPAIPGTSPGSPAPGTGTDPQPIPDQPPVESASNTSDSGTLLKEDYRVAGAAEPIENRVIQILQNIKWTVLARNAPPASLFQGNFEVLNKLTYNQKQILGLATSVVPPQVREDLDSRVVGCLQGGTNFLTCTRNVIWPTLHLYVKDMPNFPEEEKKPALPKNAEVIHSSSLSGHSSIPLGIYRPTLKPAEYGGLKALKAIGPQAELRSAIKSQIVAEPEESPLPLARIQSDPTVSSESQEAIGSIDRTGFIKSSVSSAPVISVTGTRFTPIFSDHPESVLLKILEPILTSSKLGDISKSLITPEYMDSLKNYLNAEQCSVIRVSEKLLPDEVKFSYLEKMSGCVRSSKFIVCSRDITWPALSQYYPALPSFPSFNIEDATKDLPSESSASTKSIGGIGGSASPISETDVKTGQHGDAVVTITDTRFYPIFSQHPEAVILGILKNVQSSSPNLLLQQGSTKLGTRSSEHMSSFTDQQGNIINVSENLLPESIREVFTKRMNECVKENSFLACTRDIAWPTIAQFFPRLPNFPNIEALPEVAIEKPQQPTLLPPQLETSVRLDNPSKTPIVLEAPGLAPSLPNLLPVVPEDVESRIESMLRQIFSSGLYPMSKSSYLSTKDPLMVSSLSHRQTNIIRMSESMVPNAMRPLYVGLMVDCSRDNIFTLCARNIGWPMLRQYIPNFPDFPDPSNFGGYIPQVPQEIPQVPAFPDYQSQLPAIPSFPAFGFPGQGFGFPFRAAQDKIDRNVPAYFREGSLIPGGYHPGGAYVQGIRGITPSVDSSERGSHRGSSSSPSLVPGYPSETGDLLSEAADSRRRIRRSLVTDPIETDPDISSANAEPPKLNITESEFLQILINVTKQNKYETRGPEVYFVEKLNTTMKAALTEEQFAILKIVEDLSTGTTKAGFMSKVVQCITSLSFIRCMGIFVWPVITQTVPSLLGLPTLGSLNPFGRSSQNNDSFADIFGMSRTEFEKELVARKQNVEGILVDWYRGIVEEEFSNDFGFVKIRGYGDGEIGISFNGFSREGRIAKLKDHKNLPSILTIISDIMEDVLDQRETKPDNDRKKLHGRRENVKRGRSIGSHVLDDYNRVPNESENTTDSERSSNDDEIIAMFLDKIKTNGTSADTGSSNTNHYLSAEDAYEAFELLFGTRLSERMAERLNDLNKSYFRLLGDKKTNEENYQELDSDKTVKKQKNRSGLILRLPKIGEEFISRKMTDNLTSLGRKIKVEMSQLVPGATFVVSFFIQMALSHARAAASIAGMMSNMALGSAVMSLLRESLFGPSTQPKIKYLYDNEAVGPGIVWPQHNHHG